MRLCEIFTITLIRNQLYSSLGKSYTDDNVVLYTLKIRLEVLN